MRQHNDPPINRRIDVLQRARPLAEDMDSTVLCWAHTAKDLSFYWSTPLGPAGSVQSFSIPVGSFAIHPWIRTGQLCTGGKGDSSVFCTKKEGYLGVCQATQRVDSTGERLY